MKEEPIETVAEHCQHKDCIYRASIESGWTPICYYAVLAGQSRGCKISECDKYRSGQIIQPRLTKEMTIYWERGVYDEDIDAFWARYIGLDIQ